MKAILLAAAVLFLLAALVFLVRFMLGFKRALGAYSEQAAERLLRLSKEMDRLPERWHEYDEVLSAHRTDNGARSLGPDQRDWKREK